MLAFSPHWVEIRYDFDTPFGYHSSEMFEYAMRSLSKKLAAMGMSSRRDRGAGLSERRPRPGSAAPGARRPAPPSASSRPRYEVLKRDGYAGLTTAKVAAASGQNKALISYYFGSKQGLVAAVARRVSETITDEVLGEVGEPASPASWSRRWPRASGG